MFCQNHLHHSVAKSRRDSQKSFAIPAIGVSVHTYSLKNSKSPVHRWYSWYSSTILVTSSVWTLSKIYCRSLRLRPAVEGPLLLNLFGIVSMIGTTVTVIFAAPGMPCWLMMRMWSCLSCVSFSSSPPSCDLALPNRHVCHCWARHTIKCVSTAWKRSRKTAKCKVAHRIRKGWCSIDLSFLCSNNTA